MAGSPQDLNTFIPSASALAWVRRKALRGLADAEIWLRSDAPDAFSALQAALEDVESVNHACVDVLSSHSFNPKDHFGGGLRPCAAYPDHPRFRGDIQGFFAAWPAVDERAILERLRQIVAQAASRALNSLNRPPTSGRVVESKGTEGGLSHDADRVVQSEGASAAQVAAPPTFEPPAKRKRSTQRGEAKAKILSALLAHHRYDNGSCGNLEPMGVNELARQANVAASSVTGFFNSQFGGREREDGHYNYKVVCMHPARLAESLKVLDGGFSPHELFGRNPRNEGNWDEDEDE
jgi:hypothetical protein